MPKAKTITVEDVVGEEVPENDVIRWRKRQLVYGGFSMGSADVIAHRTDVDYRYAIDVLKNSGNEELTVRIVL